MRASLHLTYRINLTTEFRMVDYVAANAEDKLSHVVGLGLPMWLLIVVFVVLSSIIGALPWRPCSAAWQWAVPCPARSSTWLPAWARTPDEPCRMTAAADLCGCMQAGASGSSSSLRGRCCCSSTRRSLRLGAGRRRCGGSRFWPDAQLTLAQLQPPICKVASSTGCALSELSRALHLHQL